MSEAVQCAHNTHRELKTQRREMRDGAHREGRWGTEWERVFGSFGRSVRVWVFRLSQTVRFAPFFFFFLNFGLTGRYGPSRPDLGRVSADFSSVNSIRESPRGTTRHGRTVCGVPLALPRPAASDVGALAWESRPCIPAIHPKIRKWSTAGFLPLHASSSVIFWIASGELLFNIRMLQLTASG